jgi:hypothetical protein
MVLKMDGPLLQWEGQQLTQAGDAMGQFLSGADPQSAIGPAVGDDSAAASFRASYDKVATALWTWLTDAAGDLGALAKILGDATTSLQNVDVSNGASLRKLSSPPGPVR